MKAKIGVIGGSGLYEIEGAKKVSEIDIPTPFGMPSDTISIIEIGGTEVAFLPRHGKGHRILPTEVPSKANIWALKSLGISQILAISAVGSLREEMKPGDFVICDQIIDRTKSRPNSYFGEGVVGHVAFAEPFCPAIRENLAAILDKSGTSGSESRLHKKGTVIAMEGPLFSTKGESHTYRQWNADVIGMTALPEAKLAREAEICYAMAAMVTDYDCWRETEEAVTIEMILKVMAGNVALIKKSLKAIIEAMKANNDCVCNRAARFAIMTDQSLIPYETKRKLRLFYGKYWEKQ